MQRIVLAIVLTFSLFCGAQQTSSAKKMKTRPPRESAVAAEPLKFVLWEKQEDLRRRAGTPQEYFVPRIQKVIGRGELRYYADTYRKVDDVFYRETPAGRVRILVAYANDESQSHLDPDVRVEKLHFFFDKDVTLRKALAAIAELRDLCSGGCILNGFSSTVVAQPAAPNDAQMTLAQQMKPHWRGQDMSDATPGAEVFYLDSLYPVDFEHSPVERIDYTLVSNASRENYTVSIVKKQPTVLDIWHPHIGDAQVAVK